MPYFFQIRTIRLLFFVNLFGDFMNIGSTFFFMRSPRMVKKKTLVIKPATVIRIISKFDMPAAGPSNGGNIDLRQANK